MELSTASPDNPHTLPPLVVDLDGTLIRTDMLHESALQLLRTAPWQTLRIPVWLSAGKAALKARLAQQVQFDPALLPYHEELLDWLRVQRATGRKLILCTASDRMVANSIAAHCGLFDEVLASDGETNLSGARKAQVLTERFGAQGFDYAGNAAVDLPVWAQARRAVVVNAPASVLAQVQTAFAVDKVFPSPTHSARAWTKALRIHQWLKNALLFAPLFAAHELGNLHAWSQLLCAFVAFCLCASSVYVSNDLLDLESDRLHPRKRLRPFASGALPLWQGVLLAPLLALAGLALALLVSPLFAGWLVVYFALTWVYTLWLKRALLIDCLTLASLYTLRVVAGAAAAQLALSFWLLAFSGFLFLSLSFVKRYAELQVQAAAGNTGAHGRAYRTSDAPLIQTLGVACGYTSVVVLALYLNSDAVLRLYAQPQLAWAAVPILVWWVSWMWLRTFRGEMHDDPLIFAFRDIPSLLAGMLFGAVLLAGSLRWPW